MKTVSRLLLILVSGFGTLAGLQLSLDHLRTGETCPEVWFIPACYLVLVAYGMILGAAVLMGRMRTARAFIAGWIVVFGLAASGVVMELVVGNTCPSGPGGIPQCFFSFLMAVGCLIFYIHATGAWLGQRSRADETGESGE